MVLSDVGNYDDFDNKSLCVDLSKLCLCLREFAQVNDVRKLRDPSLVKRM